MIKAQIIKDSVNPAGQRLTSFIIEYPRIVHSEALTHRVWSRNSASSRAIPAKKMRENILAQPATPEWWGANQAGMQAAVELEGEKLQAAKKWWSDLLVYVAKEHERGEALGIHKQIVNRVTEPWMHITVLVTCSEWNNFFALRAHKDAQPEIMVLAYRMLACYLASKPQELDWGQWHIPFEDRMPPVDLRTKLKIATARAARLSYLTFEGEINVAKDIELHDRLVESGHCSPLEHCAFAQPSEERLGPHNESAIRKMLTELEVEDWLVEIENPDLGNFNGWRQYRKILPGENRTNVDLRAIMAAKPEWVTL